MERGTTPVRELTILSFTEDMKIKHPTILKFGLLDGSLGQISAWRFQKTNAKRTPRLDEF